MNPIARALTFTFAVIMLLAGSIHFFRPYLYAPIIPFDLPISPAAYVSGALECIIGIGLFIPRFRLTAARLLLLMMMAYLPLHVWDVFRARPAMGSPTRALIRLALQGVLIAWALFIYRTARRVDIR